VLLRVIDVVAALCEHVHTVERVFLEFRAPVHTESLGRLARGGRRNFRLSRTTLGLATCVQPLEAALLIVHSQVVKASSFEFVVGIVGASFGLCGCLFGFGGGAFRGSDICPSLPFCFLNSDSLQQL
jgi:hypothetical protein